MKKLLVISDTGMFQKNGSYYAFQPVVIELEHMLSIYDKIHWIGFERPDQKANHSYVIVDNNNICLEMIPAVGGQKLSDKIDIIRSYPYIFSLINKSIKQVNHIHLRSPSNPALIGCLFAFLKPKRIFWFKYAGSWVDKASLSYTLQRYVLKYLVRLRHNVRLSINGDYDDHPRIFNFQNPCISNDDHLAGKKIVKQKRFDKKLNICFVGNLTPKKGVDKLLVALKQIDHVEHIGQIDLIGDGKLRSNYMEEAQKIDLPINFHGFLNKDQIFDILTKTHVIILPSLAEGFPKVISEGMNFGCYPIVSSISCISQIITHKRNGLLLFDNDVEDIKQQLMNLRSINNEEFIGVIQINQNQSYKFTYENYIKRIKNEIFV